jgi:8-oxo-dGTP diphosphatase
VGFPHPTHDVPGHDEALARVAAASLLDPFGHAAQLAAGLRGADAAAGHVCATAWVLDPAAESTLLVRHPSLGWVEPGGHIELGEAPAAAAARELLEETGLVAAPFDSRPALVHAGTFPARGADPEHCHWNIGYLFVVERTAPLAAEVDAPLQWFEFDQLPGDAVPDLPHVLPALRQLIQPRWP